MTVLRGPMPPPDDIVIVAIDESSIREFAPAFDWPWPRRVHGELIRQLDAAGARAIVFDVVFDLPSPPEDDAALASAIRASHAPVVLAAALDAVDDRQFKMTQQLRPLPDFVNAGARVGFATISPDADGRFRLAPLSVNGSPSLAAAAVEASGRAIDVAAAPAVARSGDPQLLINFSGPSRSIHTVSYYQAVDAARALPPGTFRGKTVFVGRALAAQDLAAGVGSQDLFATPFDLLMPGVEIHASAANTLARGLFIRRAPPAMTWILLVGVGAVIAAVMTLVPRFRTKIAVAVAWILLTPVVSAWAFLQAQYWLYTVQPLLVSVSVFGLNALYQYRASERDRAYVRKALTGYVSKPVMQRLLDNPSALELGGTQVEATVLFSDIVGFSSIAERMTPRELTAVLNEYFTRIGDAIMAEDGMIDKYIGDAIMAVWGAPLPDPRHASKACAAALAMRRTTLAGGPLKARIGLNTGLMMAGNLGHRERMEYTVIGDAVNLASRLEGANKLYGTLILASETTKALAADEYLFRRIDRIRVVGKQEAVGIFELIGASADETAAGETGRIDSFGRILDAYDRRDWTGAFEQIARHRAAFPAPDPVVALYEDRCRRFAAEPPPPDWDGVYIFTSK